MKIRINSDFGNNITLPQAVAERAARAVCMNNDADESLLLLDMLGLIPPRPGNEPKEIRRREGTKAERSEQNKREFAERRQVKKAKLEKNGYRPEEYGEVD